MHQPDSAQFSLIAFACGIKQLEKRTTTEAASDIRAEKIRELLKQDAYYDSSERKAQECQ